MTEQNLPPTKNVSLEEYLAPQKENTNAQVKITKLESQILQLKEEISKLKSKRAYSGGVKID